MTLLRAQASLRVSNVPILHVNKIHRAVKGEHELSLRMYVKQRRTDENVEAFVGGQVNFLQDPYIEF